MRIKIPEMATGDFGPVEEREAEWQALASPGTEVTVKPAGQKGPETVESIYDVAMSTPWLLEEIRKAEGEGFDAVIIPCMADPGLHAAREISNIPVIGESEISCLLATALGHKFSVLQPIKQSIGVARQNLRSYGLDGSLASVRTIDVDVNEMVADPEAMKQATIREGRKAIDEDGADVLVVGCGFMAAIVDALQDELGVPVIHPYAAAIKYAEMLVAMGLSHSKKAYMTPPKKKIQV